MNNPKYYRIRRNPDTEKMIEEIKHYACIRDDGEALKFALDNYYFHAIGQYKEEKNK